MLVRLSLPLSFVLAVACGGAQTSTAEPVSPDRPPASTAATQSDPVEPLQERPTREQVAATMYGWAPGVSACGHGTGEQLRVRFLFEGATGRVKAATLDTETLRPGTDSPAFQACVLAVFQEGGLPPFRRPTFSVTYPFRL